MRRSLLGEDFAPVRKLPRGNRRFTPFSLVGATIEPLLAGIRSALGDRGGSPWRLPSCSCSRCSHSPQPLLTHSRRHTKNIPTRRRMHRRLRNSRRLSTAISKFVGCWRARCPGCSWEPIWSKRHARARRTAKPSWRLAWPHREATSSHHVWLLHFRHALRIAAYLARVAERRRDADGARTLAWIAGLNWSTDSSIATW